MLREKNGFIGPGEHLSFPIYPKSDMAVYHNERRSIQIGQSGPKMDDRQRPKLLLLLSGAIMSKNIKCIS